MLADVLERLNEAIVITRSGDTRLAWRVHSVRSAELRRAGYDLLLAAGRPGGKAEEPTNAKKAAELLRSMVLLEEGLVCAGVVAVSEDGGTTWKRCIVHGDVGPGAAAPEGAEVLHVDRLPDAWRKQLAEQIRALSSTGSVEGGGDHGRSFRRG